MQWECAVHSSLVFLGLVWDSCRPSQSLDMSSNVLLQEGPRLVLLATSGAHADPVLHGRLSCPPCQESCGPGEALEKVSTVLQQGGSSLPCMWLTLQSLSVAGDLQGLASPGTAPGHQVL